MIGKYWSLLENCRFSLYFFHFWRQIQVILLLRANSSDSLTACKFKWFSYCIKWFSYCMQIQVILLLRANSSDSLTACKFKWFSYCMQIQVILLLRANSSDSLTACKFMWFSYYMQILCEFYFCGFYFHVLISTNSAVNLLCGGWTNCNKSFCYRFNLLETSIIIS